MRFLHSLSRRADRRPLPRRERRDRFVVVWQQMLVLGVMVALVVPAMNTVNLEMVNPAQPGSIQTPAGSGGSGETEDVDALALDEALDAAVEEEEAEEEPMAEAEVAPVQAVVTEVALEADAEVSPGLLVSAERELAPDSTIGLTWSPEESIGEDDITLWMSTRTQGTWSDWEAMDYHDESWEETQESRPGTEAVFTGDADAVQIRVEGVVPRDLKLAVVDPGQSVETRLEFPAIDTARLTAFESGDPAAPGRLDEPSGHGAAVPADGITLAAGVSSTARPRIYSRAQWGAKESMRRVKTPTYGEIHGGFVHHTVNANNYTKSQVPKIIRGIYAFHTQSRKWNDIGYNFLVDRWGRIWEGRYGGVGRPVVGAHTSGYNSNSFAMSAIGNYQTKKPGPNMLKSFGKLFAWKLSQHGIAVRSAQKIGNKTFQAISGHRNAGSTACPGRYLYAKLGRIRTLAAGYQKEMGSRQLQVNISGSAVPEIVARDASTKRLSVISIGTPFALGAGVAVGGQLAGADLVVVAGDVTGDGRPDLVVRDQATQDAFLVAATASGLADPVALGDVLAGLDSVSAAGDINGDGYPDLIGHDAQSSELLLFPGTAARTYDAPTVLSSSWSYRLTTFAGDLDRDGSPELIAVDAAGRVWSIDAGQLPGALGKPKQVGSGFSVMDTVVGVGDITGDGGADLLTRATDGRVRIYPGGKGVALGAPYGPYTALAGLSFLGGGNFIGNSMSDVVGVDANGTLVAHSPNGSTGVTITDTGIDLSGVNLLLNAGDWNRDGRGDIITRETKSGRLQLRLGRGNNTFAAPVYLGTENLNSLTQVTMPGDVTGDGHLDLIGRWGAKGAFFVYPGAGTGVLQPRFQAKSALPTDRLAAAGLFDRDGAVDFFTSTPDGRLWLYRGNGPGGISTGSALTGSVARMDWLLGLGDVSGDGRPDLLARDWNGGLTLLTMGTGGIARSGYLASGMERFDLAG